MDKGSAVREMFDKIAGRYDLANTVMTGGIDVLWRKQAAAQLALSPDARVLDLCCGTGALTRELGRRVPQGDVVGVDFSPQMLAIARARPGPKPVSYQEADILALPFERQTFDAATMAFSLRNITDIPTCLREVARVLKPGGIFVNLEVGKPDNPLLRRAFFTYFYGLIPLIGGLAGGDHAAYRYLPQSLINFPDAYVLAVMLADNGFTQVRRVALMGGVANLHIGSTPPLATRQATPTFAVSQT